jgi:hypothetical protein
LSPRLNRRYDGRTGIRDFWIFENPKLIIPVLLLELPRTMSPHHDPFPVLKPFHSSEFRHGEILSHHCPRPLSQKSPKNSKPDKYFGK